MLVTKEMLEKGLSFSEYLKKAGESTENFLRIYNSTNLPKNVKDKISSLAEHYFMAVFSEPWCPDCVAVVPVLAKMAELNPHIELYIFPRDTEWFTLYYTDGRPVIPTVVVFDQALQEKGRFIERPRVVVREMSEGSTVKKAAIKARFHAGDYSEEIAKDLLEILGS